MKGQKTRIGAEKKLLSKGAWIFLGIGAAIIIAAGAGFGAWSAWTQAQGQQIIAQQQEQLAQVMEQIYQMRDAQDLGGTTPEQTLYEYTESVEIGFYKIPSTYFIRSMRPQELHRFDGVSRDKVWQFVLLMKAETTAAANLHPAGNMVTISSPIPITLKKASNGVWQLASIDYSFENQSTTSN